MTYIYNIILHNSDSIPISRATRLADMIQEYIDTDGTHVQSVTLQNQTDVMIAVITPFKLEDLFSVIYDNRAILGYKEFSIHYSETYKKITSLGYGA